MLRILFTGGGSVGHLSPSLAVWEALKQKKPKVKGLFVCSMKKEDRIFLRTQKVRFLPIITPRCTSLVQKIFFFILLPIGCIQSLFILLIFRPHVIFSKGGYASIPIACMGWILHIPIVLHESDRVMGKANQVILRFARHLCIGTPQKEIANDDVMTKTTIKISSTGNPVRKALLTGTVNGGRRVTKFSGKKPVLLVIGGSQGSQAINKVIWGNLDTLISICDVIHITGRGKLNSNKQHGRYLQLEVLYKELEDVLALADIVVSRAGAGAIAELSALGKATILIPLPELANRHQEENARFLRIANAVMVLEQKNMGKDLIKMIKDLAQNTEKRRMLGSQFRTFADPDAASRIANILISTFCA